MGNNECGMYSLFFIVTMLTNKIDEPNKIFNNYKDKIEFFKKERITDSYMNKYRNIFFNIK